MLVIFLGINSSVCFYSTSSRLFFRFILSTKFCVLILICFWQHYFVVCVLEEMFFYLDDVNVCSSV